MTRPNLSPQLAAIIRDAIAHRFLFHPFPDFDADTELAEITDSLDRQTIGFGIEEITGCEVAEWDVMRWRTVADVIAHLALMRGDEHMFWKRCNQHPPYRPEAGL